MPDNSEPNWLAVSARAQAYQALHLADLSSAPIVVRANFLMTLGLSRSEAAALLGSSDDSLRVQMARAKKKAGSALGAKNEDVEHNA